MQKILESSERTITDPDSPQYMPQEEFANELIVQILRKSTVEQNDQVILEVNSEDESVFTETESG